MVSCMFVIFTIALIRIVPGKGLIVICISLCKEKVFRSGFGAWNHTNAVFGRPGLHEEPTRSRC